MTSIPDVVAVEYLIAHARCLKSHYLKMKRVPNWMQAILDWFYSFGDGCLT